MSADGLVLGLQAMYELIYVYGAATIHLDQNRRDLAVAAESAHRDARDQVIEILASADIEIPQAGAGYPLSTMPVDNETASALISDAEDKNCEIWRSTLAISNTEYRADIAKMFTLAARSVARWRRAMGSSPSVQAFPGRV